MNVELNPSEVYFCWSAALQLRCQAEYVEGIKVDCTPVNAIPTDKMTALADTCYSAFQTD